MERGRRKGVRRRLNEGNKKERVEYKIKTKKGELVERSDRVTNERRE